MFKRNTKGFTLVELLVVIAIIGILASIVLVSLNSTRQRSRDVRRVADISQIRTALESFFLDNAAYPTALSELTTGGHMTTVPNDPTGTAYSYDNCGTGNRDYTLGIALENASDPALDNDVDSATCTVTCTDPNYCVEP